MDELSFANGSTNTEDRCYDNLIEENVTKPRKKRKKKDKNVKPTVPSVQRAWKVGYNAAQANLPESRNPFMEDSSEYTAWLEGWWSGFYDEPLQQLAVN